MNKRRMHYSYDRVFLAGMVRDYGPGIIGHPEMDKMEAVRMVRSGATDFVTDSECDNVLDNGQCGGHSA